MVIMIITFFPARSFHYQTGYENCAPMKNYRQFIRL